MAMGRPRQSKELLRQLTENVDAVFWMTDPDRTEFLYVSPAYEAIFGASCGSLYARPRSWFEAICPEDRDRVREALTRQVVGRYDEEYRIVRPDGSERWIWDRAFPLKDERQEVYRLAGIAEDVTRLKTVQEALRRSEERYAALVELLPDVIYSLAPDGTVTGLSPTFEKLTGWRASEWLGKHFAGLIHEQDRPHALERLQQAMRGELPPPLELRVRCNDSRYLGVEFWTVPSIEEGEVVAAIGSARDISHRKRLEEALVRQARDLAVLEERNRIAREIHDTLAQGFTGILLQLEATRRVVHQDPARAQDFLASAKGLAQESLQEARRSLWDLMPRALEENALEEALQQEVQRFADSGPEKVTFSLSGERQDLPPEVQRTLLRVCQEALTNVRRHARASEVKVKLTFDPSGISLRIRDNGVGFESDAEKPVPGAGTGRGLTALTERARLLGGDFAIESQKGRGTAVNVRVGLG